VSHVGWPNLVSLSMKLRAFRSVLDIGRPYGVIEADTDARLSFSGLQRQLDACVLPHEEWYAARHGEDPSEPPLQQRSRAIATLFEHNASARVAGSLGERVHDLVRAAGETRICESCASSPGAHRCGWTKATASDDAEALRLRGDCLAPVVEMFNFCREMAATQYARHAAGPGTAAQLALRTGFGVCTGATRLAVQGTISATPGEPWRRNVSIRFDLNKFGYGDYLALPYIIAHESIAHGHCGVAIDDEAAEDSIAFHDGWMDVISYRVLARSLSGHDSGFLRFGAEFERWARQVNDDRYSANDPAAREWRAGKLALNAFELLVADAVLEHGGVAMDDDALSSTVDELSLQINASSLSHEGRAVLVDGLNKRLSFTLPSDVRSGLGSCDNAKKLLAQFVLDPFRPRENLAEQLVAVVA
jgi:hypothetical protein